MKGGGMRKRMRIMMIMVAVLGWWNVWGILGMALSTPHYSQAGGGKALHGRFYDESCPRVESIVSSYIEKAIAQDARMAASLLRLHFHDCFVNGCDASVLLDDAEGMMGEKSALPNVNSLRGFEVIDNIKDALERACPHTVSCADILVMAARDAVTMSGGPYWQVVLGRRDSLSADKDGANMNIPGPASNISMLIKKFEEVGLSVEDMVTLSGAHTIGQAHCATFRDRLEKQEEDTFELAIPMVEKSFLHSLKTLCPSPSVHAKDMSVVTENNLAVLDTKTPIRFDNQYYKNLLNGIGLLSSDQALVSTEGVTRNLVYYYATHHKAFFENFPISMVKMGNIKALTNNQGQIRKNCRVVNY